jgi:hypothetical protein
MDGRCTRSRETTGMPFLVLRSGVGVDLPRRGLHARTGFEDMKANLLFAGRTRVWRAVRDSLRDSEPYRAALPAGRLSVSAVPSLSVRRPR